MNSTFSTIPPQFSLNISDITKSPNNSAEALYLDIPNLVECSIAIFGLITVTINISVFAKLRLKDTTYKFLLVEAFLDFVYLTSLGLSTFFDCGMPCAFNKTTYISRLYSLVFDDFLTSSIAINNISIEIFLSIQRLFIMSNRPFLESIPFAPTMACISLVALAYYTPVLFLKKIVALAGDQYDLVSTYFGQSNLGLCVPFVLSAIRLVLVTICLFTVNFITLAKFKKHIKIKSKLLAKISNKTNIQSICTNIYTKL